MKDETSILHTLSCVSVEDSLNVQPDKYYWVFLAAEIVPDGCPDLITPSVQLHATKKPPPPEISVDIYGLKERQAFGKEMDYLVDKRDRLKTNITAMNNSVLAKGEKVRDEEIQRKRVLLHRVEKRLREVLSTINEYTGTLSVVLKISSPCFDAFSEPIGYRVLVNNEIYENLPLDTKKYCMKLGVDEPLYNISVVTLSNHVVGHSKSSESVQVSSKEFQPIRFFCYFSSHIKHASWPDNGSCCLEDVLEYERQYADKPYPQRSFISERIHAQSFNVMGIFDGVWEPLGKHFEKTKPTALLFWTKWCASSKTVMQYYSSFAKDHGTEYQLLSCCVFSDEPIAHHQSKVMQVMNEHNWSNTEGVKHFCACHPGPNSKLRKRDVENSSFAKSYRLLGVPTLVLIDSEGYITWQGRVFADNAETFSKYLQHTFSVITKSDCPIKHCDHCDSEVYGFLYSEKEKPVFTTKDLPMETFNTMMAKQTEDDDQCEKTLGKTGDYSGVEAGFLDTTRSIGSSKSYSVRFSEDSSIASPDSQLMSTATSRSSTSLEGHFDNSHSKPKTGSISSTKSRSSPGNLSRGNSSSIKIRQPGSKSSGTSHFSKPMSRYSRQDGWITRSRSLGTDDRSSTAQSNSKTSFREEERMPSEKRAVSAFPNIGRGREKVSLPQRPKTSTSMYRSKEYDWVQSRYSQDNYVPYNPYKGKSYAKNGAVMTFYSKSGYIPIKPFPKDTSKHKVSWKSNMEIPKQKVPSHREIKYMRDGDYEKR